MIAAEEPGARRRRPAADAARRARRAGARDRRVRRAAARRGRRSRSRRTTSGSRRSLAGGDDARAAAHLLSSYLEWQQRPPRDAGADPAPRGSSRVAPDRARRRRAPRSSRSRSRRRTRTRAAPTTTRAPPPPPKPFRIVFPEGFTRAQMAERVQAVAKIAERKRARARRARPSRRTSPRRSALVVPCFGRARQTNLEGFLFPATYDFLAKTTSKQLVARADQGVLPQLAEGRPRATRARRT